jgi:hypothetical protein
MAYELVVFPFKDPEEVLDYDLDWSSRLTDGDTITASTWALSSPPDAVLRIDSETETTTVTKVWLSGGTLGQVYNLTNHVTTAGGRQMEQTCQLVIAAK